jgi:hypothetical protein
MHSSYFNGNAVGKLGRKPKVDESTLNDIRKIKLCRAIILSWELIINVELYLMGDR